MERAPDTPTLVDETGMPDSDESEASAYLVVIYGDALGKRITLSNTSFACGRDSNCELPLDDETVSRRHAEIRFNRNAYRLYDLNSTNGTRVNGQLIKERTLHNGDQVKIGRTIFKFLHGDDFESNYHELIYRLMTFDGLTQAHNHRFFKETLAREFDRAKRYQRPLALILLDIDHFKKVNDTHGHLAGDEALRRVAEIVLGNIRAQDFFARVGGEEFAVIVPEGSHAGVMHLADRLRTIIAQERIAYEKKQISLTCSFGVAWFAPGEGNNSSDLYRVADQRMYAAKEAGRNCIVGNPTQD